MWSITLLSLALVAINGAAAAPDLNWWKHSIVYQIYPRSFKDSDGDGIGDLKGITEKLDHLRDAGVDALWLSPIFSSPQKDFGYDISNFTDITREYGTLEDFDKLVAKAKSLKLKVLLDFVPNHSSDEHEWFKKSVDRIPPYDDYYIWRDGKILPNGTRVPPNNWLQAFGGSAWEWNEKRKQYYYHAFVAGQPDLNYRNPALRKEMENVLTFWFDRGVDGFRVDAVNHLFEDVQLRDDPLSGNNVPPEDYDYLNHVYTRDLDETYEVVGQWQKLIDDYVKTKKTDGKFMILEAYTTLERTLKFYEVGSNPFNFMFIASLNNGSSALDFKRVMDNWLNVVPSNKVLNWVTGNHDNHRVASRYGYNGNRADQITMLCSVLPGITVVYNGDEIGMEDREMSWEETVDPSGCRAGPERYKLKSRDPERTPYQWDNTTSAGFSSNPKTWLPVNENYNELNLAVQKAAKVSHYKVFQALAKLKKSEIVRSGSVEVLMATEKVLAVVRRLPKTKPLVLLINFSDAPVSFDARSWLNIPEKISIKVASVQSDLQVGKEVDVSHFTLPAAASVILN